MSYAKRAAEKARRRQLDAADPERRQVRNLIKRGKAPRLTIAQDAKGKIPNRGRYKRGEGKFVLRMGDFIRFTFGAIFANKAAGRTAGGA